MNKRNFLLGSLSSLALPTWAQDTWGEKAGYPTGRGPAGSLQMWESY